MVCAARGLWAGFPPTIGRFILSVPKDENDDIVGCNLIAPSRRSGEWRFMRAAREDDEVEETSTLRSISAAIISL